MNTRAKCWIVLWLITMMPAIVPARTKTAEPSTQANAEIEQALTAFLAAFDNLDWPAFRDCFAPDATMFHPAPPNIRRIDSPQDFEKAWLGVFARIRKTSGKDAPPYMQLKPLDLRIQLLSEDVALVTFHLVDGTTLSRRTIILKHSASGWKIVHIHASNFGMPAP